MKSINFSNGPVLHYVICMYTRLADSPAVRLEVGKALNLNDLEEGDDIYFECSVVANPAPYKVTWLHNVSIID